MTNERCDLGQDFLINYSRGQRSAVGVSKGTLAPIWFPRVQMPYGIVRPRLHDCLTLSPARQSLNSTSDTKIVFCPLSWRALLSIPPPAREHLQLPRRDSAQLQASHQIPLIDRRVKESSPNPSIGIPLLSHGRRRCLPGDDIR